MRFMALVKGPQDEGVPPQALMDAMDKYVAEQAEKGVFLDGGGLSLVPQGAARVRIKRGKLHITDGPFAEAKEVIGGYAILQYDSWEEAMAGAREFMELHIKHWPEWEGECEIRRLEEVPAKA
jgi:hypothetical protein